MQQPKEVESLTTQALEKQHEEQLRALLEEIVEKPIPIFKEHIEQIETPQECLWLLKALVERPMKVKLIRRVWELKKHFDKVEEKAVQTLREQLEKTQDEKQRQELLEQQKRLNHIIDEFTQVYKVFSEKKDKYLEMLKENTKRKEALLEELINIVKKEQVKRLSDIKRIAREWKKIGPVHPQKHKDLEATYKTYMEQFRRMHKQYMDTLIEQDRMYNLQKKKELFQRAKEIYEQVKDSDRIVEWHKAKDLIQTIAEDWDKIGPVGKENEQIELDYRSLMKEFFATMEKTIREVRETWERNIQKREALLKELEAIAQHDESDTAFWKNVPKRLRTLQKEWSDAFPIPKEQRQRLKERYREVLKQIYEKLDKLFESFRKRREALLAKKREILEEATKLMEQESNPLKRYRAFLRLQRLWNRVKGGRSPAMLELEEQFQKVAEQIINEYQKAKPEQEAALQKAIQEKDAILQQLHLLQRSTLPKDTLLEQLKQLIERWRSLPELPRKLKAKYQERFYKSLRRILRNVYPDDLIARENFLLEVRMGFIPQKNNPLRAIQLEKERLRNRIRELRMQQQKKEQFLNFIAKDKKSQQLREQILESIRQLDEAVNFYKEWLKRLDQMAQDYRKADSSGEEDKEEAIVQQEDAESMAEEEPAADSES